jgi:hypothetical protein
MPAPPKFILHSPLSDETSLEAFVETCLAQNVSLIAVVGLGSAELEELIDEIVVGNGNNGNRFVTTTSHPNETFEDVLSFVRAWNADEGGMIHEARF